GPQYCPIVKPRWVIRSFEVGRDELWSQCLDGPENRTQQIVSLELSENPAIAEEGLSFIFFPWRHYITRVRCTESFPYSYLNKPESMVYRWVFCNPFFNFTNWIYNDKNDHVL